MTSERNTSDVTHSKPGIYEVSAPLKMSWNREEFLQQVIDGDYRVDNV